MTEDVGRVMSAQGEGGVVAAGTVAEVAVSMRELLATIDAGEMSCSSAYRHRLQGAVLALEALCRETIVDVPPAVDRGQGGQEC